MDVSATPEEESSHAHVSVWSEENEPVPRSLADGRDAMPAWRRGYLYARSMTIGGGTSNGQRNIVEDRILGGPRR